MAEDSFRSLIRSEGERLYRDLPWRRTRDPYATWLSEVMLQQTQVVRVLDRLPRWLECFPDVSALASASTSDVLAEWQGMGYNRRALALHAAAQEICHTYDGVFPKDTAALVALPGVGPATAQGIRAFAFDLPGVYLETNVRTVFLHHFFPDTADVPDKELIPLVAATCPISAACSASASDGAAHDLEYAKGRVHVRYAEPQDASDTPRAWYYALLDYGAYLKKSIPNPSRRSRSYAKQSRFEGSHRQKRANVVRILLDAASGAVELTAADVRHELNGIESKAGRSEVDAGVVDSILDDLASEGFCVRDGDTWRIP